MGLLLAQPGSVSAQAGDGIRRQRNAQTGKLSFIGPTSGCPLSAPKALETSILPEDSATALAKRFGSEFGLKGQLSKYRWFTDHSPYQVV